MEDSDDLKRFLSRIVNDQLLGIRVHNPKAERQGSQIFPHATGEWRVGQKVTGPKNGLFNPVRRFRIILASEVPNLEEIAKQLSALFDTSPSALLMTGSCSLEFG